MKIPPNVLQLKCHLKDYRLENISFREEKDGATRLVDEEDDLLDIDTVFSTHKESSNRYIVLLNVDYTKRLKDRSTTFRMQCSMYGFFESKNAIDEQMKGEDRHLLWVNGATILYGLLRPTVASVSSQCFAGRILLRTVMMTDVVNDAIARLKASAPPPQPAPEQAQLPPAT